MKHLKYLLAFVSSVAILVSTASPASALGGWVEHRFKLQRPDGSTMNLKGGKMHIFHDNPEGEFKKVNNFCVYPEKDPNFPRYVDEDDDADDADDYGFSGSYHCLTPQSCSNTDFGAPYLPKSFNSDQAVYNNWEDASYRAFNSKKFTDSLTGDLAYLASKYQSNNIRGFEGAKWKMKLEHNPSGKVGEAGDGDISMLNSRSDWGVIPGFEGKQRWSKGEVYKDSYGENQLHARITWVLEPPNAPAAEKPTASLAGKCANNSPGVPTYTYTLSNINLRGQQFADNHLYLRVQKLSSVTDEFKREFGPPIYENDKFMEYSLIFNTTAPSNNTITMTVAPNEKIGNKPENTKTLAQLVAWVDAKRKAGAILPPWEIATNLRTKNGDTFTTTDYISASFRPKFETNECGQPPTGGGGGGPACVSIQMQNASNQPITNFSGLKPGDRVKFMCGPVAGVNRYAFRVVTFNQQGAQTGTTNLNPESTNSNRSAIFTIPNQGGKFTAQCALCPNGNCQEFEIPNYVPSSGGSNNSPTACPNTCVAPSGCITQATGNYSCPISGQVCCTNLTRDE